ncbi:undecaprenyl-phosphate glucose phosphotransferase [Algibacter agarivorans]|uniref:Undecaprenyl-phosphate glucose phosphotransferase n=1 Tax=Algibacter agarivorans TaxID=1109741 RepID=A0ABP9GMR9_9FLAO
MISNGNYSKLIRPVLYILDLLIITVTSYYVFTQDLILILILVGSWFLISLYSSFYNIYRYTKITRIVSLLSKQVFIVILLFLSYLFVQKISIDSESIFFFFFFLYVLLVVWRTSIHFILKKYRIITGSNYKQVVIIGSNDSTKKLEQFFIDEPGFGYKLIGFFTNQNEDNKLGSISESFDFIVNNKIDEVYCSMKELTNKQIKEFIEFCDIKVKSLKFIPDNKDIYSKNLFINYYDITPILSLRELPLDNPIKNLTKRIFDVIFSLIIICFVLSWLIPILGLIIILESKGPIFFQQNRPGIKEQGFGCYKFRSMAINSRSEDSATRNDARITRVGKFIRRTSIDELPQFFNVLFGTMSVVGPRPHLWRQNEMYGTKISKYMVRHFVKPGVTGLAQVRGYRGEIETREDIVNRTKYDIFYIENWSFLMDFTIIIQTVINVFKGEEKAY